MDGFEWILYCLVGLSLQSYGIMAAIDIDAMLDRSVYDNRIRPGINSGQPVIVYLDMFVVSIGTIDEVKMEYSISIFMRQRWVDDRFNLTGQTEDITLNYNLFDRLWVPDLFIKNEKKATFHEITVPNRLIKISPNGQVYYSQRLTMTLNCNLRLTYYPMDNQSCTIELESYGYTTKDIVFEWKVEGDPVQVPDNLELPEFELTNTTTGDCTQVYVTGSFTCLDVQFHLKRQFQYYLIQIFIPSCLIVSLSWVSFWIDIHAVPARVTLGLLTVLTMTTQSTGISARLPRVSYIKAIDVWMTCCLVFVFGGLIEYSIVNVLARKEKPAQTPKDDEMKDTDNEAVVDANYQPYSKKVDHNSIIINTGELESAPRHRNHKTNNDVKQQKKTKKVKKESWQSRIKRNPALGLDMAARGFFPLIFLVFNIGFWITYKVNGDHG